MSIGGYLSRVDENVVDMVSPFIRERLKRVWQAMRKEIYKIITDDYYWEDVDLESYSGDDKDAVLLYFLLLDQTAIYIDSEDIRYDGIYYLFATSVDRRSWEIYSLEWELWATTDAGKDKKETFERMYKILFCLGISYIFPEIDVNSRYAYNNLHQWFLPWWGEVLEYHLGFGDRDTAPRRWRDELDLHDRFDVLWGSVRGLTCSKLEEVVGRILKEKRLVKEEDLPIIEEEKEHKKKKKKGNKEVEDTGE